jgi:hypothetical protein
MGSNEDRGRSRRPGAEDRDGQAQVEYSMAGRSRGRVTLCAVCTVHKETMSAVSWLSLKTKVDVFPSLGLKTGSYSLVIWVSKSQR